MCVLGVEEGVVSFFFLDGMSLYVFFVVFI